jgi:hypothetical protein
MEYRAYTVGHDGHLSAPKILDCADDEQAIATVKGFLNGKPVELWEGARLVVWCERFDDDLVILRPEQLQSA